MYTFTAEDAQNLEQDKVSGLTRGPINDMIQAQCKKGGKSSITLDKPLSADLVESLTNDGFVIAGNTISWHILVKEDDK